MRLPRRLRRLVMTGEGVIAGERERPKNQQMDTKGKLPKDERLS